MIQLEVAGVRDSVAFSPGYGRINRWYGAIDYELSWDAGVFDTVNHRDFADGLRGMWLRDPQTAEKLAGFDQALKGRPRWIRSDPQSHGWRCRRAVI